MTDGLEVMRLLVQAHLDFRALREQHRESAALPGWLVTTTARECVRVVTAARRSGSPAADLALAADLTPLADDAAISTRILTAERDAALHAALAQLPARCQQLLAMLTSDAPSHADQRRA